MTVLEIGLEEARFKAAETVVTGLRTLEFYAAAFSKTPDKNGDIIAPHAFDTWLPAFYAEGKALPISFNHAAVIGGLDPTDVVGYAPADASHVWVDDYGLRVKGFLDTTSEKGKAVEWQIQNGLLLGASLAFTVAPDGLKKQGGHNLITRVEQVLETGPVPNPANQEAVLLWMKSAGLLEENTELPYMSVAEFRATFSAAWDGNAAMTACSGAADYRAICAAEHDIGTTDQRQHWAGPHHSLPGDVANETGVRAALSRWGTTLANSQVQNITQSEWASGLSHLQAHMSAINPDYQPPKSEQDVDVSTTAEIDAAVVLTHQSASTSIQSAHDALVRAGAKCATVGSAKSVQEFVEEVRAAEAATVAGDDTAARQRKFRMIETSLP